MYQKQQLLVCIILLFILTLPMLVHFGEIIITLHVSNRKITKQNGSCYKWCSFNGISNSTLLILRLSEISWYFKLNTSMFFMIISAMKSFLIYLFH